MADRGKSDRAEKPDRAERPEKLDVPQGTLELMILTILGREPMHGYGISQRLATLSGDRFQVNPGSLFPSLYRLEQDGKLKAEWRATRQQPQRQVLPPHAGRTKAARTTPPALGPARRSPSTVCWRAHDRPAPVVLDAAPLDSAQAAKNVSWTMT